MENKETLISNLKINQSHKFMNDKTRIFIQKARKVHGDRYDYSKVDYKNAKEKVIIICPIHGEFLQSPTNHLQGFGCKYCANNTKLTTEDFVRRAEEIHGKYYDYSKVHYVSRNKPVTIICPAHGKFQQLAGNHLNGEGCCQCGRNRTTQSKKLSLEDIINKANKMHNGFQDYQEHTYY